MYNANYFTHRVALCLQYIVTSQNDLLFCSRDLARKLSICRRLLLSDMLNVQLDFAVMKMGNLFGTSLGLLIVLFVTFSCKCKMYLLIVHLAKILR